MLRQTCRMATLLVPKYLVPRVTQLKLVQLTQIPQFGFAAPALPKHRKLTMPALSPTMEMGNILKWLKKEGEQVAPGDVICEVETDKATVGFEVQEEGYLAKILIPEGTKRVAVGQLVAILVLKKVDLAAFAKYEGEAPAAAAVTPPVTPAAVAPAAPKPAAPKAATPAAPAKAKYPKHHELGLPALSPTMEKGNLMKWLIKEGDKITAGDVICEIETDKATVGFEVQEEGYIAKILVKEGTKDIPIGTVLAVATPKKDSIKEFANYSKQSASAATETPVQAQTATTSATPAAEQPPQQTTTSTGGRVLASPLAKATAQQHKISLDGIQGTGIDGSIIKKDVDNYISQGGAQSVADTISTATPVSATPVASTPRPAVAAKSPTPVEGNPFADTELSNMRMVIASRLLESKTTIPHYYLTIAVTMDKLLKLREELNKISKVKISVNDFIIKASALALRDVPAVNSHWHGTFIRKYTNADINMAVSTDAGLITPIIFNAGAKGLSQIAQNSKEIAEKARSNKLKPAEYQGGTFTISNLGMFGIDSFIAVINPPQAAILAVSKSTPVLVPGGNNEVKTETHMNVTLSCDHRVVDGAVGAQWLQKFKGYMEEPSTMLL